MTNYDTLKPGTAFVTQTNGLLAFFIRLFTFSRWNHAGIYMGVVNGVPSVIEATPGKGLVLSPAAYYPNAVYWRQQPTTDEQNTAICAHSCSLLGTPYGFLDIAALGLNNLRLGRLPWVTHRLGRVDRLICSQHVDWVMQLAGFELFSDGRLAGAVSPGDEAQRFLEQESL